MAIEAVTLHTNPNAPEGANAVHLYNTDLTQGLTLGQLLSAVCLRLGAALERQSVTKMNSITERDDAIEELSAAMQAIADGTVSDWGALREILTSKFELTGLPDNLDSYANRLLAMAAIKQKLENLSQVAQEDMIDLQTTINRRDVAYSTSTGLIRALGQTSSNLAANI